MLMKQVGESVTRETDTIQISCSLDNQTHKVTDDSLIAGQHTGSYEALCEHRAPAAALATPLGRACAECAVVSAAQQRVRTVRLGRRFGMVSQVAAADSVPPAHYRHRPGDW
jgi:hypothetical protein